MDEAIKTIEFKNGQKIKIYVDDMAENPREWDNVTTMICSHKRYNLGDVKESKDFNFADYNNWNEVENAIVEKYSPMIIKPLYMYEHSGITISTSTFSCKWDSGQIGFVFISKNTCQKEFSYKKTLKELERILESEVKTYDQYLRGEVYSFVLYDVPKECNTCKHIETEIFDSCSGFYDIKDIVDFLPRIVRQEFLDNI